MIVTRALTAPGAACKLAAAFTLFGPLKVHRSTVIVSSKKPRTSELDPPVTAEAAPTDFEGSLSELESIVEQLEQGDLSLDESLKQFERGVQLTRVCQGALKQAEQKVEILLRKTGQTQDDDAFVAAPFASDE